MNTDTNSTNTDGSPALAVDACYAFFYVSRNADKIEEMRAVKHTDKTVWITGRWSMSPGRIDRSAMRSEWGSYFPTRQEAVAFLRNRLEQRIAAAETTIAKARQALAALA